MHDHISSIAASVYHTISAQFSPSRTRKELVDIVESVYRAGHRGSGVTIGRKVLHKAEILANFHL